MHVTAKYYIVQQETLKSFGRKNHEISFVDGKSLSKTYGNGSFVLLIWGKSLEDCKKTWKTVAPKKDDVITLYIAYDVLKV